MGISVRQFVYRRYCQLYYRNTPQLTGREVRYTAWCAIIAALINASVTSWTLHSPALVFATMVGAEELIIVISAGVKNSSELGRCVILCWECSCESCSGVSRYSVGIWASRSFSFCCDIWR